MCAFNIPRQQLARPIALRVSCKRRLPAAVERFELPIRMHSTSPNAQQEVGYNDSPTDIIFIALCRLAYGKLAGWQSPRSWMDGEQTFRGMVEVSRALMKGRSASQQHDAVIAGFPHVPPAFRRLFPYSQWGAEINASITPAFFTWLVGPMQTIDVEVELPDGQRVAQRSGMQIERCRYLAESQCVGMCNNLCKVPVQTFFTEQLGMPLYMEPNFDDFGCKMTFGQVAPPQDVDPIRQQPCLGECTTLREGLRCHKME